MTEAGFSGNARYVLPAVAAIAVLGGVGAALLVEAAGRVSAAGRLTAAAVLLAGAAPELATHVGVARSEGREAIERSRLHTELEHAVDLVGARYTTLFGPATVNRSYQTHLAWELSLPVSDVYGARGRGISFSSSAEVAGPVRILRRARPRATIVRVGELDRHRAAAELAARVHVARPGLQPARRCGALLGSRTLLALSRTSDTDGPRRGGAPPTSRPLIHALPTGRGAAGGGTSARPLRRRVVRRPRRRDGDRIHCAGFQRTDFKGR